MDITRPNQVWAADITYIPMASGLLYLAAIMDWHSRYVVAWNLSNTLDAQFCVEALEEALEKGRPDVFNTDQGSQFTSEAFTGCLDRQGVRISMDRKGRYSDNIFVERLWRTVKYETVYLKAYTDGRQAKADLAATFASTTPNGHIRPLATEHRSRCSTETWYNHPNTPQKGEIQRY